MTCIHDAATSTARNLTRGQEWGDFSLDPAWSPDGRELALVAASGYFADAIVVLDLETGESRLRRRSAGAGADLVARRTADRVRGKHADGRSDLRGRRPGRQQTRARRACEPTRPVTRRLAARLRRRRRRHLRRPRGRYPAPTADPDGDRYRVGAELVAGRHARRVCTQPGDRSRHQVGDRCHERRRQRGAGDRPLEAHPSEPGLAAERGHAHGASAVLPRGERRSRPTPRDGARRRRRACCRSRSDQCGAGCA